LTKHFVSEAIEPLEIVAVGALPSGFTWRGQTLTVAALLKTWRSTKNDRGDEHLKRHWFEFETGDGRVATVYFDRGAKRGQPRWWLYAISAL
jgi:hypothetical protein